MAKFIFYQDELRKIWYRNEIEVEAETKEEAAALVQKCIDKGVDACDTLEQAEWVNGEWLYEPNERIDKEDNDNRPTIEVLDSESWKVVASN